MSNGRIDANTEATGVELLVTATDTGPTDPGQDEIIVSVFDGMVLHAKAGVTQQIHIRAQSAGPGFCAVEGELLNDPYGFVAPPIVWSPWHPLKPALINGGQVSLTFRAICSTDASAQVRYVPEPRSASGIATLSFINTLNTDDPITSADAFCMVFDGQHQCAWVKEDQTATFTLVGKLGSLELVDLLPSPSDEGFVTDGLEPAETIIGVALDVKPRSSRNIIDLRQDSDEKEITVAILTSSDSPRFDATEVDISSLVFGLESTAEKPTHIDVDNDGDQDLRVKFRIDGSGIECGNTLVTLNGATESGQLFAATDSIATKCAKDDATELSLIRSLGDINGDDKQDFAALVNGSPTATVKDVAGTLVSTVRFDQSLIPVDMEVMQDINENGAPELVVLGQGSTVSEVRDSLTGELLGSTKIDSIERPIDVEIVSDQNGNSIPELAILGELGNVEIADPLWFDPIKPTSINGNFNAKDLSVFGEPGAFRLAVLGENKDSSGGDKVEVRDMLTGDIINHLWLGSGWTMRQLELLPDINGNGAPEAAVLRVHSNPAGVSVLLKDTLTGSRVNKLGFDAQYPPVKMRVLPDLNGNGADDIVVFGVRPNGGNQKAWVKDGRTNRSIKQVFFNKTFLAQDFDVCPDINGNGADELVALGRRQIDGKLRAIIKDARTGELIKAFNF